MLARMKAAGMLPDKTAHRPPPAPAWAPPAAHTAAPASPNSTSSGGVRRFASPTRRNYMETDNLGGGPGTALTPTTVVGVGLLFDRRRAYGQLPTVTAVEQGGGAGRQVAVGDQLETVNGAEVRYLEADAIARRLMGPENSVVELGLLRCDASGQAERITAKVTRSPFQHVKKGMSIPKSTFGEIDPGLDLASVLSNMRASASRPDDDDDQPRSGMLVLEKQLRDRPPSHTAVPGSESRPSSDIQGRTSVNPASDGLASPPKSATKPTPPSRWNMVRQTFKTASASQEAGSAAKARPRSIPPTITPSGPGSFGTRAPSTPAPTQPEAEEEEEEEEEEEVVVEEETREGEIEASKEEQERPAARKGLWGKVRGSVKTAALLKSAGRENAKTQAAEVATLGIVLDGLLIEAVVPGAPAYHSNGTIEKGDRLRKLGTVMVTAANVKEELNKYYQEIGADVLVSVKKAASGDNAEVKLRTVDTQHFKYQIMMTEAIAKVSASVRKKANFTRDMMLKHSVSDPNAKESAHVINALREETDERLDHLLSIFTKREYERVEREKDLLRELKRVREENELFKKAHSQKKKQQADLQAKYEQTAAELHRISGTDMQQTLTAQAIMQTQKEQLEEALREKERQIIALSGHDGNYQVAVDKVASLTEVTLTQTAEIFRLNEMVIRMDNELREVRSQLHHREMGVEEALIRWHAEDGEDPFGEPVIFEPNRSLAGVWVPLS